MPLKPEKQTKIYSLDFNSLIDKGLQTEQKAVSQNSSFIAQHITVEVT